MQVKRGMRSGSVCNLIFAYFGFLALAMFGNLGFYGVQVSCLTARSYHPICNYGTIIFSLIVCYDTQKYINQLMSVEYVL